MTKYKNDVVFNMLVQVLEAMKSSDSAVCILGDDPLEKTLTFFTFKSEGEGRDLCSPTLSVSEIKASQFVKDMGVGNLLMKTNLSKNEFVEMLPEKMNEDGVNMNASPIMFFLNTRGHVVGTWPERLVESLETVREAAADSLP